MTTTAKKLDRRQLRANYETLRPLCEASLEQIREEVRAFLELNGYTPTIKYRVKRFDALFGKLHAKQEQGKPTPITDLLGLRIICPFLEDLERIEELLVNKFTIIETEHKAVDHSFREFGYDSVHLLIQLADDWGEAALPGIEAVCEIQLRTILQDAWAEVEHELVYKSDLELPNDSIRRKLASLNASLTLSDLIFQEIRDYQRDLRQKRHQRRQSMEQTFSQTEITLMPPTEATLEGDTSPLPSFQLTRGNALERTMVEALQTHSAGRMERAIELYSRILRMKASTALRALVYNHRGMALFALSDYRRALKDFSRAIEIDANPRSYNNRGLTWRVLGEADRSLEDYDRSLELDGDQLDAWWGRAQTRSEMKLYAGALSDCRKVLELQEDHPAARGLLRRLSREIF